MTDQQKNWFMVAWPVILFFVGTLYGVGASDAEMKQMSKEVDAMKPLVAKVAVLEATNAQVKEDVTEIKADVKAIRDVLIGGANQPAKE
jgi:hypothetical protein